MAFLRFLCGLLVLLLVGCNTAVSNINYLDPSLGLGGTGGTPTTITSTETDLFDGEGGQPPTCCVADKTSPFEGPSWFQFGEPGTLGPCPEPTTEGVTGYHVLKSEPHTCPACTCSPAACSLPEGIHTNAAKCADADGSVAIPFGPDPAAGWEGVCSSEGALPANLQCGSVACIQSFSIPAVSVAPCKPESDPADPLPEPLWGRMAQECVIDPLSGEGCGPGQVCAPEVPGGLTLCLHANGEHPTCPPDYPEHVVFYQGVKDDRGCDACQCSPPEGAQCLAIFEAFFDATCSALSGAVVVTDQEAACVDVLSGTALGSAEASMAVNVPGSCASSGGSPIGGIQPSDPLTLCCQGEPKPPG